MTTFDPIALEQSAKRREKNILAFEETIRKEQAFIDHYEYVISKIDPEHPDVKKLESTIKKKKANIKTFEQAIKDERILIKQELIMAKNRPY